MRWVAVVRSAVVAGVLSGVPSTIWALTTGTDVREPTLAAGSLLLPNETRPLRLASAAAVAHAGLCLGWTAVLAQILPREHRAGAGVGAGLLIAGLDLGVVGRRYPRIRALPLAPQLADHIAFGLLVALTLPAPGDTGHPGSARIEP